MMSLDEAAKEVVSSDGKSKRDMRCQSTEITSSKLQRLGNERTQSRGKEIYQRKKEVYIISLQETKLEEVNQNIAPDL